MADMQHQCRLMVMASAVIHDGSASDAWLAKILGRVGKRPKQSRDPLGWERWVKLAVEYGLSPDCASEAAAAKQEMDACAAKIASERAASAAQPATGDNRRDDYGGGWDTDESR